MRKTGRRLLLAGVLTTVVAVSLAIGPTGLSSVASRKPELKTSWGEPNLEGIWTRDVDIPLERPARYANQEFFTEAQRGELDRQRSALLGRDKLGCSGIKPWQPSHDRIGRTSAWSA